MASSSSSSSKASQAQQIEKVYEVKRIITSSVEKDGTHKYKVQWASSDRTLIVGWIHEWNFVDRTLIDEYEQAKEKEQQEKTTAALAMADHDKLRDDIRKIMAERKMSTLAVAKGASCGIRSATLDKFLAKQAYLSKETVRLLWTWVHSIKLETDNTEHKRVASMKTQATNATHKRKHSSGEDDGDGDDDHTEGDDDGDDDHTSAPRAKSRRTEHGGSPAHARVCNGNSGRDNNRRRPAAHRAVPRVPRLALPPPPPPLPTAAELAAAAAIAAEKQAADVYIKAIVRQICYGMCVVVCSKHADLQHDVVKYAPSSARVTRACKDAGVDDGICMDLEIALGAREPKAISAVFTLMNRALTPYHDVADELAEAYVQFYASEWVEMRKRMETVKAHYTVIGDYPPFTCFMAANTIALQLPRTECINTLLRAELMAAATDPADPVRQLVSKLRTVCNRMKA